VTDRGIPRARHTRTRIASPCALELESSRVTSTSVRRSPRQAFARVAGASRSARAFRDPRRFRLRSRSIDPNGDEGGLAGESSRVRARATYRARRARRERRGARRARAALDQEGETVRSDATSFPRATTAFVGFSSRPHVSASPSLPRSRSQLQQPDGQRYVPGVEVRQPEAEEGAEDPRRVRTIEPRFDSCLTPHSCSFRTRETNRSAKHRGAPARSRIASSRSDITLTEPYVSNRVNASIGLTRRSWRVTSARSRSGRRTEARTPRDSALRRPRPRSLGSPRRVKAGSRQRRLRRGDERAVRAVTRRGGWGATQRCAAADEGVFFYPTSI